MNPRIQWIGIVLTIAFAAGLVAWQRMMEPNLEKLLPTSVATDTVVFDGRRYSPRVIRVTPGTAITFENKSSEPFWPASDFHPTHTRYPERGDCGGSLFDACDGIAAGGQYQVTLQEGVWRYHDHLNPQFGGTILVTDLTPQDLDE